MTVVLVHNQKGGVGKSTTVTALARLWSAGGARVLVVDGDQQAHASMSLGVARDAVVPAEGTYGVLRNLLPVHEAVRETAVRDVWLLAGHADLATVDLELASTFGRETVLRRAVQALQQDAGGIGPFDVVLLDLGAARNVVWANAVVAADWLIVPTHLEAGAVDGTVQLVAGTRALAPVVGHDLPLLAVIPTRVPVVGRTRESRALEAALRSHFAEAVTPVVHESPRAASALGAGVDLVTFAPESRAARDYTAIASTLATRLGLPTPPAVDATTADSGDLGDVVGPDTLTTGPIKRGRVSAARPATTGAGVS